MQCDVCNAASKDVQNWQHCWQKPAIFLTITAGCRPSSKCLYSRIWVTHTLIKFLKRQSSRRKTKVFFLLSFSDLSHHRTCGSAYGGSLFYVQSDIVIHKTGIAREPEFIIGRCMVHYTLRICPIPLAAIPIYACPIGLDSAFDEIGNPCLWVFPTFPYTHSYPSAKPLINSYQR